MTTDNIRRPILNFKDLDEYDRRLINWYYFEDLKKFNELTRNDKIIKSNESYFIYGPGGSGKTIWLKQIQSHLKKD